MLIDKYLPLYQFSEYHSIEVRGTKEQIYLQILTANLRRNWLVKILLRLGRLPHDAYAIEDITRRMGFVKLAEETGNEVVYGIITTSSTFNSCHSNISSSDFFELSQSNVIRAAINFSVKEKTTLHQIVSTETRVLCGNRKLQRRFRCYWFVVKPFSQLLRKAVLKELKNQIEKPSSNESS